MTDDDWIVSILTTGGPMLLFVREVEVVALISQRYRNHEIATRLCLSDRTVENHVHRILAKVGARSRTTLAEWAYDARLSPSDEPNQHVGQFEAIAGGLSAASSQAPSHVVEYSRLTDRRGPALAQFAPRWLRNGSVARRDRLSAVLGLQHAA